MKTEGLPHRKSHQENFRESVQMLVAAGKTRTTGLRGEDVPAAYVAAAIALQQKNLPNYDLPGFLRTVADGLEQKE